jgi:hypothetical protein
LPKGGGSQRQVEAAEHEVWDAEVDDEHCRGVPDLRTGGTLVKHFHQKSASTITCTFIHFFSGYCLKRREYRMSESVYAF